MKLAALLGVASLAVLPALFVFLQVRALEKAQIETSARLQSIQNQLADISRLLRSGGPSREAGSVPNEPISLDGTHLKGSQRAQAILIEYADFQCPFCGTFARQTLPAIEQKYVAPGKLRIGFRQLPLVTQHAAARRAAEAAECGATQGRFWEMYEALFMEGQHLDDPGFLAMAKSSGANVDKFRECMSGATLKKIDGDISHARDMRVSSTPTFFVGVADSSGRMRVIRRLTGAVSVDTLSRAVDEVLTQIETNGGRAPN